MIGQMVSLEGGGCAAHSKVPYHRIEDQGSAATGQLLAISKSRSIVVIWVPEVALPSRSGWHP